MLKLYISRKSDFDKYSSLIGEDGLEYYAIFIRRKFFRDRTYNRYVWCYTLDELEKENLKEYNKLKHFLNKQDEYRKSLINNQYQGEK